MKSLIIYCCTLFLSTGLLAQDPVAVFNLHRDSIPKEAIHLHFNKHAFVAGETVWFKAYTYSPGTNLPVSTTLYAELLNERGDIIQSKKLPVLSGRAAAGQFELPAALPQGIYLIRAWTSYTRFLDASYIFKKALPVFSSSVTTTPQQVASGFVFQWFPEGGKLINGVDNVIAFRCTDNQFQPVKISGTLLDSKGKSLGTFNSNKYGLGYFSLTAVKGESYSGEVTMPDNSKQKFELPAAVDNGVVLSVVDHELGKIFTILTPPGRTDNLKEVTLLAVMNDNIVLNAKVEIKNNEAQGLVSNEKLSEGIIRLMIFDNNNNLLAQRSAYVTSENSRVPVELKTAEKNFSPKAFNNWSLQLPAGVQGNFSVSVTDADKELTFSNDENIFSSLLWQGGSSSFISNTQVKDDEVKDMLMLTGSRHADNWGSFSGMKKPDLNEELHLPLKGKLYLPGNNKLITDGMLNLMVKTKDSVAKEYSVPMMKDGGFKLFELVYEDTARIYYRWASAKNEKPVPTEMELEKETTDYSLLLKNLNVNRLIGLKKPVLNDAVAIARVPALAESARNEEKLYSAQLIKPKTTEAGKNKTESGIKDVNRRYTSGVFKNMVNTRMIDLINEPPTNLSGNIFDYIMGRLGGVTVERSGGRYTLRTVRGVSTGEVVRGNASGQVAVKTFLNESEVTSDVIARIPVEQIALVKFFPTGSISLSGIGLSAVFSVYTKKVEDIGVIDTRYFNSIVFPGYDASRPFRMPDYSAEDKKKTDLRSTLFWKPDITLEGSANEISVSFYNNDTGKRFRIVLEGITTDGRLVSFEKVVEQ